MGYPASKRTMRTCKKTRLRDLLLPRTLINEEGFDTPRTGDATCSHLCFDHPTQVYVDFGVVDLVESNVRSTPNSLETPEKSLPSYEFVAVFCQARQAPVAGIDVLVEFRSPECRNWHMIPTNV